MQPWWTLGRQGVWRCLPASLAGIILMTVVQSAHAEPYVAGQLGQQFSNSFGNVETTGGPANARFSDLALDHSLLFGAKAGYFFSQVPNLGLEVEAFHAKPNIKSRASTFAGPVSGIGEFGQTDMRVITVALNVIARARLNGFEPYAGVGFGMFFARLKDGGTTHSDNGVPGLNALAGFRSFFSKNTALFVEYKYNRAHFNFSNSLDPSQGVGTGLKGDYEAHAMMFGLAYHFE